MLPSRVRSREKAGVKKAEAVVVAVDFGPAYKGPTWRYGVDVLGLGPYCVPITQVPYTCDRKNRCCGVRAFPLQVSYATSIHKMQGETSGKGCATTHAVLPPPAPVCRSVPRCRRRDKP